MMSTLHRLPRGLTLALTLCTTSALAREEIPARSGDASFAVAQADPASGPQAEPVSGPRSDESADAQPSATGEVVEPVLPPGEEEWASEEIVVVGALNDPARVAGSAHRIGEEKLERLEQDDIHRVLSSIPGVYLREEDGSGLRPNIGLRGALSDRSSKVTLLEDGIPIAPAPYSAPAAYYFPLVTRMVEIDVFKGPAAIVHGPQTVGGAIDLRTRRIPYAQEGYLDLAAGQYRNGKIHGYWGTNAGRFGVLLEGVHLQSGGFKELDGGGDTGFAKNELMAKARYHWDDALRQQTHLKLGYSDERSSETYVGLTEDDFLATPNRRYAATRGDEMRWSRTEVALTHRLEGDAWRASLTAYRQDFTRSWTKLDGFVGGPALFEVLGSPIGINGVLAAVLRGQQDSVTDDETLLVGTNDRRFVSQGLQLGAESELWTGPVRHVLSGGVRLHHDEVRRKRVDAPHRMLSGVRVPSAPSTSNETLGFTRALAAHLRDELTWGPWMLVPGGRLELYETHFVEADGALLSDRHLVLLPGLGLTFQATQSLSLLAGVHRGFSPVSPGQPAGTESEGSWSYELGGRWLSSSVRGELVGFFSDYFNLTGTCSLSAGCAPDLLDRQLNAGRVNVGGVEAMLGWEGALFAQTRLLIEATYTFTASRFLESFTSLHPQLGQVTAGDSLPYVPEHQGALSAGLTRGPFELNLALAYVGAMREVASRGAQPDNLTVPGHAVLDVGASYHLEHGQLYVTADNLLGVDYLASRRPHGARPGKPRTVMVGYKHTF